MLLVEAGLALTDNLKEVVTELVVMVQRLVAEVMEQETQVVVAEALVQVLQVLVVLV
jgi:hypothetical protein